MRVAQWRQVLLLLKICRPEMPTLAGVICHPSLFSLLISSKTVLSLLVLIPPQFMVSKVLQNLGQEITGGGWWGEREGENHRIRSRILFETMVWNS